MTESVSDPYRPVRRTMSLAALSAALAKAQAEIEGATKAKVNPHFKSAYADLAAVWDACREPLAKHGLAVIQSPSAEGPTVTVTTLLTHSSGEWVEGDLTMTAQQNTPQGIGSCITYARRYALAAMVGIAPEDDDGNAASQPMHSGKVLSTVAITASGSLSGAVTTPAGYDEWLLDLTSVAEEGVEALKAAWTRSTPEYRRHLTSTNPASWEMLKAKAAGAKETVSR